MDTEQPTPEPEAATPAAATPEAATPAQPTRSRRRLQVAVGLTFLAAVAVVAAVQFTGLASNSSRGPTTPLPSRIAFVDASGTLKTMDDRGGSVVAHPVDDTTFEFPAWSPDGSRVAAIGTTNATGGIYVFPARGPDGADAADAPAPSVVYESPTEQPFYLFWSPDSRQITFLTNETEGLSMRVAPADGSSKGGIVRKGAPLYWDWVDPGRALLNVGAGAPDGFLGEVGLDGVAAQAMATAAVFRSPAVSHDGSHRAYVLDKGGESDAIVIESRTGGDRHEVPVPGLAAVGFAPSGQSLGFIAPAAPEAEPAGLPIGPLRVVDVASGGVRTLLDGQVVAFFWSPDGHTIATLRLPAPGDQDVASTEAGPPRPEVRPAVDTGYRVRLIFVDAETGKVRSSREVMVSMLFGLQVLPFFDQYARSHLIWSRDSTSIVLPLVDANGVDGIVVEPADGSPSRRLADGEMGFWSP